jgi:hypothetical protein
LQSEDPLYMRIVQMLKTLGSRFPEKHGFTRNSITEF